MSKKLPVYLEIDEVRAMLDEARDPRDHLIVHLLYKTGLRVHELTSLKIEHIDFENRQIMVVSGKGDKDRFVDIDDELVEELEEYVEDRDTGVVLQSTHRRGSEKGREVVRQGYRMESGKVIGKNVKTIHLEPRQMSDRTISRVIKDLADKAGITKAKRVTPHTLRHTFACHSLMAGVSLTSIQKSMGHTNLATTQVYMEAIQDRAHVKKDYEAHPLPKVGDDNG